MSSHPTPIPTFFAAYSPSFTYNPHAPSSASEFRRLCQHQGWAKGAPEQKTAWKDFQIALGRQFTKIYGSDAGNVKAWHRLCDTLRIEPVPATLKDAREAVLNVYANPVDLIEGFKGSKEIKTFSTEAELAEYSRTTGKIIAPSTPGAGDLLKMLLNPRSLVLTDLQRTLPQASLKLSDPTKPNPILRFFEAYPSFTFNAHAASAASEFRRLCEHKRWEKGDPAQKAAWVEFQNALAKQFNSLYGVDAQNLKLWQRICSELKIEPVPTVLEDAQGAVFDTHFNVVDLIEGYKGARAIQIFESDIELAEYSRRTGKIISESSPAAGELLRAIMRHTTYGPLNVNRPLKPRQVERNEVKKGKGLKGVRGRGGQGRGGGPSRVVEPEEEEGRKKDKARSTARKQLVQCSVERSGAFLDYDDAYDEEDISLRAPPQRATDVLQGHFDVLQLEGASTTCKGF